MNIINKLNNYLTDRKLLKQAERLTQVTISNHYIKDIVIRRVMFLMPGKYSFVHRDRFNQIKIQYFFLKEPKDITIQEIYSLK